MDAASKRNASPATPRYDTQPVVIVDYDPAWPERYAAERARILAATGEVFRLLEHGGSTSVPGLAAKPIIDMFAGVATFDGQERWIAALTALGYAYVPEFEDPRVVPDPLPNRRYFRAGQPRRFHLHVYQVDDPDLERHLLFRDFLRVHPEPAAAYAVLKRDLAPRFASANAGYTDAKTDFIRRCEDDARRWHTAGRPPPPEARPDQS